VASTLIAGLELAREGAVTLRQPEAFATITLAAYREASSNRVEQVA
jgi:chromatin segregation and condensation protein Rec8/ScpA/Scc1 (kleisin family)